MTNTHRRKGNDWESLLVDLLESRIKGCKANRIAGSGAIGTQIGEPLLTGDIIAMIPGFPKKFRFEAKVGYGGATQHAIKREWLNKIREEAHNSSSIPIMGLKFSGARKTDGVQHFVALDFDTFCDIMNYVGMIKRQYDNDMENHQKTNSN